MYGAIIGDLAGSIYEYNQTKQISPVFINTLIENNSFYSDDTILTIAILDAILNNGNYEEYIKYYVQKYKNYKPKFTPYFKTPFSPSFIKWCNNEKIGNSKGNGAIMRISPIGYLFNTQEEVIKQSILATIPSHYSIEALESTQIVALIIYYARIGMTKKEIMQKLKYKLNYQPFSKFNTTCNETLPNCLYALFTSNNYEETVTRVISFGGDTDTNACIVGAMAEALYGIDENIIFLAKQKLPSEFINILEMGYQQIQTNSKTLKQKRV